MPPFAKKLNESAKKDEVKQSGKEQGNEKTGVPSSLFISWKPSFQGKDLSHLLTNKTKTFFELFEKYNVTEYSSNSPKAHVNTLEVVNGAVANLQISHQYTILFFSASTDLWNSIP